MGAKQLAGKLREGLYDKGEYGDFDVIKHYAHEIKSANELMLEAADELERLQAENARLLCDARELESDNAMRRRIADDQMDVSKDRKQTVAALTAKVKELEAEIAELRELAASNEDGREYEYRRANGLARKIEAHEKVMEKMAKHIRKPEVSDDSPLALSIRQVLGDSLDTFCEAGWEG